MPGARSLDDAGARLGSLHRRSYRDACEILVARASHGRSPMRDVPVEVARRVFAQLRTLDDDAWADAFMAAAEPHLATAGEREAGGDGDGARRAYRAAYGLLRLARFPAVTSPRKERAYRLSQEAYLKATADSDPPVERVEMALGSGPGRGRTAVWYLHRPRRDEAVPVLVSWGGIDSFKEERQPAAYVAAGMAVLAIDMPGTGDAPLTGSEQTDALWDAIFDWIAARRDLDAGRVALFGVSTGGYWAVRVARTHAAKVRASIGQGGPAHWAFQPDWIVRSSRGEYPFGLADTLASAFGLDGAAAWLSGASKLSLLEQGILELPSAPLLLIAGMRDSVFPIEDAHLVVERTPAGAALVHPGGHQDHPPHTTPMVLGWLEERLA